MRLHAPYMLMFVSVASSAMIVVQCPATGMFVPYWVSIGGAACMVMCALAVGLWAKYIILKQDTALSPHGLPTTVIQVGPFRYSRNPMYVSYLAVTISVAIAAQSLWAFVPPLLYFIYLRTCVINQEERKLRASFPREYARYVRRTNRWL